MHNRLGGLLALAAALPLALAPAAQAAVSHPSHQHLRPTRAAHAHAAPVRRMSPGRAVAALHRAEHLFDVPPAPRFARAVHGPVPDRNVTLALRDLWVARQSLTGADRRTAQAILARPTEVRPRQQVDPIYFTAAERSQLASTCSDHFCVTYTTAHKAGQGGTDNAATPAEAQADLTTLEHVWSVEVDQLGYRPPLPDTVGPAGPPGNADPANVPKVDIYLVDLRPLGYYGYCAPDDTAAPSRQMPAYCVLDNDYAGYGTTPARALDVTAAHEFFHAIQFGYNLEQPKWFMEGSAVWMEDVVYNSINDYDQYVATSPIRQPLVPFTTPSEYEPYGAFTIFKFLSTWLGSLSTVREAWANAVDHPALPALENVITSRHRDLRTAFATFGEWNTLPPRSYPERASYRPAGAWRVTTLTPRHRSTGTKQVWVRSLASAPAVFLPGSGLGRHSRLHLVLQGPAPTAGGTATLQVRWRGGGDRVVLLPLHGNGSLRFDAPFSPRNVASVVVTMTDAGSRGHRVTLAASAS